MKKKHQKLVRDFAFEGAKASDSVFLMPPASPFPYKYLPVSEVEALGQRLALRVTGRVKFGSPAYSWPLIRYLSETGKQFMLDHLPDGSLIVAVPRPVPTKLQILEKLYSYTLKNKPDSLVAALVALAANCLKFARESDIVSGAELAAQLTVLGALRNRVEHSLAVYQGERGWLRCSTAARDNDLTKNAMHNWRLQWIKELIREAQRET